MSKIGIMGGTFDPIHNGHITLAREAMQQVGLEKVIFVPAKLQPFKLDKKIASAEHRLKMLELAIHPLSGFTISQYELNSPEISYTCNTLRHMREELPRGTRLYFITGTDAFLKIQKWKDAEELLREYSFIVGLRPGYKKQELTACIENFRSVYNTNVIEIVNAMLQISATQIREEREAGRSIDGLVPTGVERYIEENGLY